MSFRSEFVSAYPPWVHWSSVSSELYLRLQILQGQMPCLSDSLHERPHTVGTSEGLLDASLCPNF